MLFVRTRETAPKVGYLHPLEKGGLFTKKYEPELGLIAMFPTRLFESETSIGCTTQV